MPLAIRLEQRINSGAPARINCVGCCGEVRPTDVGRRHPASLFEPPATLGHACADAVSSLAGAQPIDVAGGVPERLHDALLLGGIVFVFSELQYAGGLEAGGKTRAVECVPLPTCEQIASARQTGEHAVINGHMRMHGCGTVR